MADERSNKVVFFSLRLDVPAADESILIPSVDLLIAEAVGAHPLVVRVPLQSSCRIQHMLLAVIRYFCLVIHEPEQGLFRRPLHDNLLLLLLVFEVED